MKIIYIQDGFQVAFWLSRAIYGDKFFISSKRFVEWI